MPPRAGIKTMSGLFDYSKQQAYSVRNPPSGDIGKVLEDAELASRGQGLSLPERRDLIADKATAHLEKLHDHAKVVAGGDGPYPFGGYRLDETRVHKPVDATISRHNLEDFLADWYGKDWPEVRERMIKAEGAPEWHALRPNYNTRNLEHNLTKPIFQVNVNGRVPSNAAIIDAGIYQANPSQFESALGGFSPTYTKHHEFSHLLFPPKEGVDKHPGYLRGTGFKPDGLVGTHIQYTSNPAELMANLAHMTRLEYGLTGRPMRTPEDRIRAVQKWVSQQIGDAPNPSAKGWHNSFGPDPILQHGPEAGNPAHGYKFMQKVFQEIIPRMIRPDKKAVLDAMEGFGSTEPREGAVYG